MHAALEYAALEHAALEYAALVHAALEHAALEYAALVHAALEYAALVHAALVRTCLVAGSLRTTLVFCHLAPSSPSSLAVPLGAPAETPEASVSCLAGQDGLAPYPP